MYIIIIGAGRIGSTVAESLVGEANDITVIDRDAAKVDELQNRLDLRGVTGDATVRRWRIRQSEGQSFEGCKM